MPFGRALGGGVRVRLLLRAVLDRCFSLTFAAAFARLTFFPLFPLHRTFCELFLPSPPPKLQKRPCEHGEPLHTAAKLIAGSRPAPGRADRLAEASSGRGSKVRPEQVSLLRLRLRYARLKEPTANKKPHPAERCFDLAQILYASRVYSCVGAKVRER
jgi:hypothetical protein